MLERLGNLQDDEKITDDSIDGEVIQELDTVEAQDEGNIRSSFEQAETLFDALRSKLESLQPQITSRNARSEGSWLIMVET